MYAIDEPRSVSFSESPDRPTMTKNRAKDAAHLRRRLGDASFRAGPFLSRVVRDSAIRDSTFEHGASA